MLLAKKSGLGLLGSGSGVAGCHGPHVLAAVCSSKALAGGFRNMFTLKEVLKAKHVSAVEFVVFSALTRPRRSQVLSRVES